VKLTTRSLCVRSPPTQQAVIFFEKVGGEISFDRAKFAFTDGNVTSRAYPEPRTGHRALAVFLKDKDGRSLQVGQQK